MKASPKVKAELIEMLKRFTDAASRRDAKGIINLFAKDSDIVMLGSEKGEGAMSLGEFKGFLRRVLSRTFTYSWNWKRKVTSMRGEVAWMTAQGFVITRTERRVRSVPYRLTAVFERRKGRWLWMHYHGSEPV